MRAQIHESLFVERIVAVLSAAFGLLATLLAAIGLYGVMSYAVSLRTREIGIRVALGAERRTVLFHGAEGSRGARRCSGSCIGLPSGYGLGRLVESQLFGLTARDPVTFAVATAVLMSPRRWPATCPPPARRAWIRWSPCATSRTRPGGRGRATRPAR